MAYRLNGRIVVLLLFSLALVACGSPEPGTTASVVVTETRVWTGDEASPWADAVAVQGNKIVAVGSNDDIGAYVGAATEVLSAAGGMLVPGFIDTHVHFLSAGAGLASVQLRDATTPDEFVARIAAFAKTLEPGEWILQGNWDHENWGGELPRRDWIDAATPNNPVWVFRLDGHMALANSLALELAGVSAETADIAGGEIVRDSDGSPAGVLKDNALMLVNKVVPDASPQQEERTVDAAMKYLAGNGVTTVHDMAGWKSLAAYRRVKEQRGLTTRIYSVVPLSDWQRLRDEVANNGRGDQFLKIGGLKGLMDGSLGSHTAAFFDPYTDAPQDRGLLLNELDVMRAWVRGADEAGLHVIVHAIGDRAIRDLLDIYADVVKQNGEKDRRFRMEHAQHIHPLDLPRFAEQNVIASMQPYHAIDDGRWADKVIGTERSKTTYAFRSLLDHGTTVSFGSDWDVAPATPLDGIYAAVMRRTLDGENPDGWVPEQKITVEEALKAYTVAGAYASFEEDLKGTIKPGMLADFVLLDRDLTSIPPQEIPDVEVLKTVVDGKVVYSAD